MNVLSKHNAGLAGSALYGGNQLESCASLTHFMDLFHVFDQQGPNDKSSYPNKVCQCNNGTVDCINFTYSTSAVPGKQFSVSVSAVGNMNGPSKGTIIVNFTNTDVPPILVNTSTEYKTLSYELKVADNQTKEVQVTLSLQTFLVSPLTPPQRITANIKVLECPKGFQLNHKTKIHVCDCSDILPMNLGVSCDIATEKEKRGKCMARFHQ